MLHFIQYALAATVLIVTAILIFYIKGISKKTLWNDSNALHANLELLAQKKYTLYGRGISTRKTAKEIRKAFLDIEKKISEGENLYEFQHWLYDNYYKLAAVMQELNKTKRRLKKLPHIDGEVRIYLLCKSLVYAHEGAVAFAEVKEAVNLFNTVSSLHIDEIVAIEQVLKWALVEYAAHFSTISLDLSYAQSRARLDAVQGRIDLKLFCNDAYASTLYANASDTEQRKISHLSICNENDIFVRQERCMHLVAKCDVGVQSAIQFLNKTSQNFKAEQLLKCSPVAIYLLSKENIVFGKLTTATKFLYLYHIKRIAKKQHMCELACAEQLVRSALADKQDISYYILPQTKSITMMYAYGIVHVGLTLILSVLLGLLMSRFFTMAAVVLALVSMPIIFSLVGVCVQKILAYNAKGLQLPAMALNDKDANLSTVIVVPRLVLTKEEIEDAFKNIETVIAANGGSLFSYTLLFDFANSKNPYCEKDEILYDACRYHYQNSIYKNRMSVLVRKRKPLAENNFFGGWEKKRGALIDFNKAMLHQNTQGFALTLGTLKPSTFAITLDCDTLLNHAEKLVEIITHPFNKDINVLSLSMRTMPYAKGASLFSRLFSGAKGVTRYTQAAHTISDTHFFKGNFTGKGLYRIKEFHEKTGNAFLDNRILCHDFIEGSMVGCREASVTALDSFPHSFSSFYKRELRWLRGDWQLLPFLLPRIKNRQGKYYKNPLSPIGKFSILANLVRTLVPIATLVCLAIAILSANPLVPLIVAFLPYAVPILFAFVSSIRGRNLKFISSIAQQWYLFCAMPTVAVGNAGAIVITLLRLIRRKKLLEWQTFSHQKGRVFLGSNIVVAGMLIAITLVLAKNPLFYAIASVFILGFVCELLQIKKHKQPILKDLPFRERALAEFKNLYAYFEDALKPEYAYLPYDNLQYAPNFKVAERTSPTNIGFALLAHACALQAKAIDYKTFAARVELIIASVERLEKHKGILYNWYDLRTLVPLAPRYVSSVDSGNFLIALHVLSMLVKGELKTRILTMIEDTQLEFLWDTQRGLFRVGYNDDTLAFDTAHYDLLASEAMGTYLIAIALGKIKSSSFYHLSPESFKYKGVTTLASWTGGMFEYLMPHLFFEYAPDSLFYKSAKGAVRAQIKYAKAQKLKAWGVSEGQYNKTDEHNNFQYKALGVPQIALSNAECPSVITPYATWMAVGVDAKAVAKNVATLDMLDITGQYGFYEAIDLKDNTCMKTFMVHHLGMSLVALCNYLFESNILTALRKSPQIRATQLLLTQTDSFNPRKKEKECLPISRLNTIPTQTFDTLYQIPNINLLRMGHYAMVANDRGQGHALLGDVWLYRPKSRVLDIVLEGQKHSLLDGRFSVAFDSCMYYHANKDFFSNTKVSLLPSGLGELWEVSMANASDKALNFKLNSKVEPVLRDRMGDIAHRAYSDMFLKAEIQSETHAVVMHRTTAKNRLYFTHYLHGAAACVYNTHRPSFYGRGKDTLNIQERPTEPVISAHVSHLLKPKEKATFYIVNLASSNAVDIKNQILELKQSKLIEAYASRTHALMQEHFVSAESKLLAAKILYASGLSSDVSLTHDPAFSAPCVCLQLQHKEAIGRLKKQLLQLKKLYAYGIVFDLYIVYNEHHGYYRKLYEALNEVLDEISMRSSLSMGSNIHLVNERDNPEQVKRLASYNLLTKGKHNAPMAYPVTQYDAQAKLFAPAKSEPLNDVKKQLTLGTIDTDYAYGVDITHVDTPRPFSNILASPYMSSIVTESGGGFSSFDNAYLKKITRWSNDSVLDEPAEFITLAEKGAVWSITKKPYRATSGNYSVKHALGYSEFFHNSQGLLCTQKVFLDTDFAIKFYELSIENVTAKKRTVEVSFSIDPVLGDFKEQTAHALQVSTQYHSIKIENIRNGLVAYMHVLNVDDGTFKDVVAHEHKAFCHNNQCYPTLSITLECKAHQKQNVLFALSNLEEVEHSYKKRAWLAAKDTGKNLSSIQIEGYSNEAILARWLPYQVLNARFYAKAGFYQAGGAIGFRDQLQDSLSLLYVNPDWVRNHIIACAARQFEKGDVLHWWHPHAVGVRTRMTDDRLFLPLVAAEYIEFTADIAILDKQIPYLLHQEIPQGRHDFYADHKATDYTAPLLEHCIKAIEVSCDFGDNGLCLMGTGDWNDAMDRLGERGLGTSMFTSMLLYYVIKKFAPYIKNVKKLSHLLGLAESLKSAINQHFFEGRFIRAITDDGQMVGSVHSKECKLDLLVQSWAVLSGAGEKEKNKQGLSMILENLIDYDMGIAKLLTPPFQTEKHIGYIADYPPGVRENGGQYSHASTWFILALLQEDKIEDAWKIFSMMNPLNLTDSPSKMARYKNEPYVLSADVYTNGQGGWSWYTGAASWYYKCLIEGFLGITLKGDTLWIEPKLPQATQGYRLMLRHKKRMYNITLDHSVKKGAWCIKLGDMLYTGEGLQLSEKLAEKEIVVVRRG